MKVIQYLNKIIFVLAKAKIQVEMDPNSRENTAFVTQWGFYEITVMFIGLTNSCATFQMLMEKLFEKDIYFVVFCTGWSNTRYIIKTKLHG